MDDDTQTPQPRPGRFSPDSSLRIALIFALFGILWTIFSDHLLVWLLPEREDLLDWLTYSGWIFVLASATLLYWLLRRNAAERAAIHARLESNAAHYRLLFENNPNPMWVYDLETLAFLLVNDAAVEKYGYSRAEFLTKTLFDIRPLEDAERLRTDVAATSARCPKTSKLCSQATQRPAMRTTIRRTMTRRTMIRRTMTRRIMSSRRIRRGSNRW